MKIIIVDKKADIPDQKHDLDKLKEDFQKRGHYVDGPYKKLIEGDDLTVESYNPIVDLGDYQVAVAHPRFIKDEYGLADLFLLAEEVKRRPKFRVIFYSGQPDFKKKIGLRQSSQVYYLSSGADTFDRIIDLVENGW